MREKYSRVLKTLDMQLNWRALVLYFVTLSSKASICQSRGACVVAQTRNTGLKSIRAEHKLKK